MGHMDEQILLNEIDTAIAVPEEFGCNEAEYREFTGRGPVLSLPKLYGYNCYEPNKVYVYKED